MNILQKQIHFEKTLYDYALHSQDDPILKRILEKYFENQLKQVRGVI